METKQPQKPSDVATSKQTTAEVNSAKEINFNKVKLTPKEKGLVLYIVRRELERFLGFRLTKQQFITILRDTNEGHPSSPLGSGWSFMGFVMPFENVIPDHNIRVKYRKLHPNQQFTDIMYRLYEFFFHSPELMERYLDVLLHIPHASSKMLDVFQNGSKDASKYLEESKDLIDYYTDELFAGALTDEDRKNIHPIVFPIIRTMCDVERLPNDPLEKKGYGIIYHLDSWSHMLVYFNGHKTIYQSYYEHQYLLAKTLLSLRSPLLIDCHSFSSRPTPLCEDAKAIQNVDICIGFNEDETKPLDFVINSMQYYFSSLGYKVALNTPFSNSKTVDCPQVKYKSVMIEVNKRLYMNEDTLEKTEHFPILQQQLRTLYGLLLHCGFVEQFD